MPNEGWTADQAGHENHKVVVHMTTLSALKSSFTKR